jgi:hypothetical protein
MNDQGFACPQCNGLMAAVVVMDNAGHHSGVSTLQYRLPEDRKPSFWTGGFKTANVVNAFMCGSCGLIQLYGKPAESPEKWE